MRREPTDKDKIDLFIAWWGEYERTKRQNERLSEALEGLVGYLDDLRRAVGDSPYRLPDDEIPVEPVVKARAVLEKNSDRTVSSDPDEEGEQT
jgi:hypothetical protein